jgi:hypothetical protein
MLLQTPQRDGFEDGAILPRLVLAGKGISEESGENYLTFGLPSSKIHNGRVAF